jgi:hypothetical protein
MKTPIETQVEILAELHTSEPEGSEAFKTFYDITLPLCLAVSENIAILTAKGEERVSLCFQALLDELELEDEGYEQLSDLIDI